MTWYRLVYLECDHPTCTDGYLGHGHDEGMTITRDRASHKGWRVWESRDYCPDHVPAGIPGTRIRAATDADE